MQMTKKYQFLKELKVLVPHSQSLKLLVRIKLLLSCSQSLLMWHFRVRKMLVLYDHWQFPDTRMQPVSVHVPSLDFEAKNGTDETYGHNILLLLIG